MLTEKWRDKLGQDSRAGQLGREDGNHTDYNSRHEIRLTNTHDAGCYGERKRASMLEIE